MLFRSRLKPTLQQRLRAWLWPRRSWRRSALYIGKRVVRLRATPHAVAAGVAAGVFSVVTPFLGLHMLIAAILAYVIGGNIVAALISTWVGNPLTYPLIWLSTFQFGTVLLNGAGMADGLAFHDRLLRDPVDAVMPVLVPMAAGSLPIGLAAAAIAYLLVRGAVGAYQAARR